MKKSIIITVLISSIILSGCEKQIDIDENIGNKINSVENAEKVEDELYKESNVKIKGINGNLLYWIDSDTNNIYLIEWYPEDELSDKEESTIQKYLNKQYQESQNDEYPYIYQGDSVECCYNVDNSNYISTPFYETNTVIQWYSVE